jgi:hypothetical protein
MELIPEKRFISGASIYSETVLAELVEAGITQ